MRDWMSYLGWAFLGALLAGTPTAMVGDQLLLSPLRAESAWFSSGVMMAEFRLLEIVVWGFGMGAASGACMAHWLRFRRVLS
jgi:hypothetical protein